MAKLFRLKLEPAPRELLINRFLFKAALISARSIERNPGTKPSRTPDPWIQVERLPSAASPPARQPAARQSAPTERHKLDRADELISEWLRAN